MRIKISKKRLMSVKETNIDGVFQSEVVPHGNGARIRFFKEFSGRKVLVVVLK